MKPQILHYFCPHYRHQLFSGLSSFNSSRRVSLGMVMWLFPPWIAFGRLFGLSWHFYLGLIPTCFCLLVIIVTDVVVVMMLVMRFFSSQRMIQFLKVVGAIIGAAAGFFLAFSIFTFEWSDEIATFLLERLKLPTSDWFPHLWAAKLMMSWLPESGVQPLRWASQLAVVSVVTPLLSVLLASKIYHRSWEYARGVEVNPKQNSKKRRTTALLGRGKIRSMMAKDFHVFLRHKGRVMMIVILTLLQLIPIFALVYQMHTEDQIHYGFHLPNLAAIVVQIMIYSMIATAGLSWGGCKAETKTWWLLKSSSISPTLLFKSKTFDRDTLCSCLRRRMGFCNINPVSDTYSVMAANPIDDYSNHSDSHRVQHSNGDTTLGRRNWRNQSGFRQATSPSICDPSGHNHC